MIHRAIETNLRTGVLHLKPGTIGFNSFTPARVPKRDAGEVQNARKKGSVKLELENKKQGVNEDTLEYYDTML